MKAGLRYRPALIAGAALLLSAGAARADQVMPPPPPLAPAPQGDAPAAPVDALQGSPVPPGLGLSPEAPPVPPAPGGRAPSFGAPTTDPTSSLRIGGRFFGWEAIGIGEKPANPLTLYVYAGASGAFTIYEDQGTTYDYEKGAFSQIPIQWDEPSGTLTIGKRQGSFPEMLKERSVQVVLVSPGTPVGFRFEETAGKTVKYAGDAVGVKLK